MLYLVNLSECQCSRLSRTFTYGKTFFLYELNRGTRISGEHMLTWLEHTHTEWEQPLPTDLYGFKKDPDFSTLNKVLKYLHVFFKFEKPECYFVKSERIACTPRQLCVALAEFSPVLSAYVFWTLGTIFEHTSQLTI